MSACVEPPVTGGSSGSSSKAVHGPEPGAAASDDEQKSDRASEPGARELEDELDRS